ncbi:MAG: DUF2905 domain-containing protein [Steroidobacteraceae bacterium]
MKCPRTRPLPIQREKSTTGLLWPWLERMHLFHLPGDIVVDRTGFKFIFPITTMLILSAVLSLLAWLLRR